MNSVSLSQVQYFFIFHEDTKDRSSVCKICWSWDGIFVWNHNEGCFRLFWTLLTMSVRFWFNVCLLEFVHLVHPFGWKDCWYVDSTIDFRGWYGKMVNNYVKYTAKQMLFWLAMEFLTCMIQVNWTLRNVNLLNPLHLFQMICVSAFKMRVEGKTTWYISEFQWNCDTVFQKVYTYLLLNPPP